MARTDKFMCLRFLFILFHRFVVCVKTVCSAPTDLNRPYYHHTSPVPDKDALSVLSSLGLEAAVCTLCRAAFDLNTHCGLVFSSALWLESYQSELR